MKSVGGVLILLCALGCGGAHPTADDAGMAQEPTSDFAVPPQVDAASQQDFAHNPVSDLGEGGVSVTITRDVVNTVRFSVMVQVGDAPPFAALLDTGSAGLRILPSKVPDSVFTSITTTTLTETYGNSLTVTGVEATAMFKIGDAVSDAPIPMMLIQNEACASADPSCNVDTEVADHFSGYAAILGIGTRQRTPVGNPIAQLPGKPGYVLHAPTTSAAGTLLIDPPAAMTAGFATVQLTSESGGVALANGVGAWNDNAVPVCVTDETTNTPYCAGGLFDTGEPQTLIAWTAYTAAAKNLPAGEMVHVALGPTSAPLGAYDVTVSSTPEPGVDLIELETATTNSINVGMAPFGRYDFWLDQGHGVLGLQAR